MAEDCIKAKVYTIISPPLPLSPHHRVNMKGSPCSPLSAKNKEIEHEEDITKVTRVNDKEIQIQYSNDLTKIYEFDKIFTPAPDQSTVYKEAVCPLIDKMISNNENSCIITYGEKCCNKSEYFFRHPDSIFAEAISAIFDKCNAQMSQNNENQTKQDEATAKGRKSAISSFKIDLNSFQIRNDEVCEETEWKECNTLKECNKWRKEILEAKFKKALGHLITTIKVQVDCVDTVSTTNQITFIDVIGFDQSFTERIMGGHVDIPLDSTHDFDDETHCHSDLFALRNLLLAIDEARTEGYELNDVSLIEDRNISKVVSHRLKVDSNINLISFVNQNNEHFQQTLNTLEFALKFRACFSKEKGKNLNIQHSSDQSDSSVGITHEQEESEEEDGNTRLEKIQTKHIVFSSSENSDLHEETKSLVKLKGAPTVSPRHITVIDSDSANYQVKNRGDSHSNVSINENDIINYLKAHFKQANQPKNEKKGKSKVKESQDISSLPMSESGSNSATILNFEKYERDKMPNALSSINDSSFDDSNSQYDSNVVKTPQNVRRAIKENKNEHQKLQIITKEIYKVAKEMASQSDHINKNQADYISKCAVKIMDIVNQEKGNKSLDTLLLELEEKEIQNRYQNSEDTILTESDIFDSKKQSIQKPNGEFDTVVVRNNVKDKINLKNLKNQFSKNSGVCTQRTKVPDINDVKTIEVKTTAATSQRKNNLEIKTESEINQFVPNKLPFDYMAISKEKAPKFIARKEYEFEDSTTKNQNQNNQHTTPEEDKDERFSQSNSSESISEDARMKQIGTEVILDSYNILADAFASLTDTFLFEANQNKSSFGSCFGCGKKQKTNKMITPRSRRIRASSQLRINNKKFFIMGSSLARSKSKDLKSNDNYQKFKENSKSSEQSLNKPKVAGKPPFYKDSVLEEELKRPQRSNDIVTANSSKPQSNLQSEKRDKINDFPKNYQPPYKVITANMNDLKSVKEELETNLNKNEPPNDEILEIKELELGSPSNDPNNLISNSEVMKNNYLMNTKPAGTIKTLEIKQIHTQKPDFFRTDPSMSMAMKNEESKDQNSKGFRSSADQVRASSKENKYFKSSTKKFSNNPQLNENFEVTSEGMMRIKSQPPKFMKARYKARKYSNDRKDSLTNSNLRSSLPKISSKENFQEEEIKEKRSLGIKKLSSNFGIQKSPHITNAKMKAKSSKILSDSKIGEPLSTQGDDVDFSKINRKMNRDGRLTKIIMRGHNSNNIDTQKQMIRNTYQGICNTNNDNIVYSRSRTKLNYHPGSISPPRQQLGSRGNFHNATQKDMLIQPQAIRTRTSKGDRDIVDKLARRLQKGKIEKLLLKESPQSNFTGIEGAPVKSRNSARPTNQIKDYIHKKSGSKGSRIEGQIDENDMLPLTQNLDDEELVKYSGLRPTS
ncbi:unnamed protein product [Moneuplotes crassus]|uniref:Kinesin motor domain-containing protein n=1 Tax=Euplotes crassus TaxID=5936 RepID=A0AAD1U6D5_EUPCR|nr:unnamed protein product [Moneuplotes crassus]